VVTTGKAVAALALAVTAVTLEASPASAHTVTGVAATNYRSEIVSVSPRVPGVKVRLLDLGRRVELTNHSSTDVVILGYEGEPYLRVGPGGVSENRRSPATYLNRPTLANAGTTTTLPPTADARAAPAWHRTGSGRSVRWRDRRTRWEGADPPAVRAAPGRAHVLAHWVLPLRHGSEPVVVTGRIAWIPGPSAVPWLLLAAGLLAITAAFGRSRRWGRLLSGAVALVVANDVVHSFATAAGSGSSAAATVAKVVLAGFLSTAAWVGGAWAVGALQRENAGGLIAAAGAGLVVALYALSDAPSLGRSQVPYAFPAVAARAAVGGTLGMGLGLVAAVVLVFRRHPEMWPKEAGG
jgi:hypothetical protein